MIKVLFITHVTNMAGANRSMFQLIKELKDRYEVCPVVIAPPGNYTEIGLKYKLKDINVECIEAPICFFKIKKPSFLQFLFHVISLWKVISYCNKLKKYEFDIIHSNSSVIDFGSFVSRKLKIKHIVHLREFGEIDYGLYPLGGPCYESFVYKRSDAFIAISKSVFEYYSSKLPIDKIHMIYNGVVDISNSLKSRHVNKIVQFVCAGIFSETKNQKEIVFAVNELVNKRFRQNFHVTLIGGSPNPQYLDEIVLYIKKHKLEPYVTILPESDGIHEIASKMDVGIVPSRAEAFGRVTVEYMLQNLLVIANNQGANPELIKDGETGLLYEKENYIALADKMDSVVIQEKFPIEICERGMVFARQHYLSSMNTNKIYKLYTNLIHS